MRHTAITAVLVLLTLVTVSIPSSDATDTSDTGWAYDSLSVQERKAYDALDYAVKHRCDSASVSYLTVAQGRLVREAYEVDHPELFWFRDGYTLYVKTGFDQCSEYRFTSLYDTITIKEMESDIRDSLRDLTVDTAAEDHKQLKQIHDWLVEHITYKADLPHSSDAYGAIVEGECSCLGYAQAFSLICHLYGFKCVTLTGFTYASSTVGHAWNIVYGEGDWYFVDVTWDDDERYSAEHDYFMVGSDTKVAGRVFATENHMADTLYGITPAKEKYRSPEDTMMGYIFIAILAIVAFAFVFSKFRASHRRVTVVPASVPEAAWGDEAVSSLCPSCRNPFEPGDTFCRFCGAYVQSSVEFQDQKRP